MRPILATLAAAAVIVTAAPAIAEHHQASPALTAALSDDRRDDDRARDQYRHPAETLSFFQVKPGMTVVDVVPGGGWYTRLLAPYLGAEGRYIGVNPDMSRANSDRIREGWSGLAGKFPEQLSSWGLAGNNISGMNLDEAGEEMAATVDRVLIFREMHNLHRFELLHSTMQGARTLLKDDGMLGIVQHRAKPWAPASYTNGSAGYMRQQDIIAMVEAHGFELVGTSEINANPKDTADHEGGVWEMKPSWRNKQPELESLGESDRMTLLFRKRA